MKVCNLSKHQFIESMNEKDDTSNTEYFAVRDDVALVDTMLSCYSGAI